jgi:ureidoglycolate lyase
MRLVAQPLTAEAFEPFGQVLPVLSTAGRRYFDDALENSRSGARPSLSIVHKEPAARLPLQVTAFERHQFSSQAFLPLSGGRWLIVVCHAGADGGPDPTRAVAFIADGRMGVNYRQGVWHHPLTVLDVPASHAVLMWRDETAQDEEFVGVAPLDVDIKPGVLRAG